MTDRDETGRDDDERVERDAKSGRFLSGNKLAVRHGLHVAGELDAVVAEVLPDVLDALSAPLGDPRRYVLATRSLAQRVAVCELLARFIDESGLLDSQGRVRPAVDRLLRAWGSLDAALDRAGLNATAAARLGGKVLEARGMALSIQKAIDEKQKGAS